MSGLSGKMPIGNIGGGGGASALKLHEVKNLSSDATVTSTSYVNVSTYSYTLPNDGKKYLVIFQVSVTNESGVANQVFVALSDGVAVDVDERAWYNAGSSIAIPIEVCYIFTATGQTVNLRAKVSNNSCRFAGGTIYGRSKCVVITLE